jgi:hypothetical protein
MWWVVLMACGPDEPEVSCRPVNLGKGRWSCSAVEACCTPVEADGSIWCEYTAEDGAVSECSGAEDCVRLESALQCSECQQDMTLAAVCG